MNKEFQLDFRYLSLKPEALEYYSLIYRCEKLLLTLGRLQTAPRLWLEKETPKEEKKNFSVRICDFLSMHQMSFLKTFLD